MTCEAKQLSSHLINCIKCIKGAALHWPQHLQAYQWLCTRHYVWWLKSKSSVHFHPNCHSNLASGRCLSLETILGLLPLLPLPLIYPGRQLAGAHGPTDSWDIVKPKLWLPELSLLSGSLGFTAASQPVFKCNWPPTAFAVHSDQASKPTCQDNVSLLYICPVSALPSYFWPAWVQRKRICPCSLESQSASVLRTLQSLSPFASHLITIMASSTLSGSLPPCFPGSLSASQPPCASALAWSPFVMSFVLNPWNISESQYKLSLVLLLLRP